jgi:hypothetical protein
MQWMGIWVHPYAVIRVQVGVSFRKNGVWPSCMMLWCHGWGCKPPLTASHIHTGCIQSVLAPWDAVDGHIMGTPLCRNTLFRWGWILGKMGFGWACMMLQCHCWGCKPPLTASHIHIGCIQSGLAFSTLRCCRWAYGYTHMPENIVEVGVNFRVNGVWPSLYDVVVSWLRLQIPIDCIPHPYWMYAKCFSILRCCGWANGFTLMLLIHCGGGGEF